MKEYHKIQSVYKRNPENMKRFLEGEWTIPEFGYLKDATWVLTEKVDGTNIRVIYKDGEVSFAGRTERAEIPGKLYQRLNDRFYKNPGWDIFNADVCLYGEGYGPKIQKGGGNYREDQDFVLFDVRIGEVWLQRRDVEDVASKLEIDVVPIMHECSLMEAIEKTKRGVVSTWGNFQAEGFVARPKVELRDRMGRRIITKIKCRDFM